MVRSIVPPIPTIPFRDELFIAIRIAEAKSACLTADLTTMVYIRFSYGTSVKGLMVSRFSMGNSLSMSATWYNREHNLLIFRIQAVALRSGFVSGRVCTSVHNLITLLQNLSFAGAM